MSCVKWFVFVIAAKCSPKCMNGGQCIDNKCQCPLGHSGRYCEQGNVMFDIIDILKMFHWCKVKMMVISMTVIMM